MDRSRDLSRGNVERPPAASTGRQSSLFVTSTEKAFLVLRAFDGPRRHLTLAEIARVAGLDRSAAQRFVYTLKTLGYLSRAGDGRSYGLTSKVLQFSLNYIRSNELIERASPYLLDLSRSLGETANLHELDGTEVVFVARFPGRHLVNVNIVVGSRLPALFTASGTAIASCLSEEEREDILAMTRLKKVTPFTEIDPDALRARVREASRTGYAIVVDETVLGDISVAAAVTDEQGRPIAGVNVSVPTTRWTVERARHELAKHVQVAATSISKGRLTTSSLGI